MNALRIVCRTFNLELQLAAVFVKGYAEVRTRRLFARRLVGAQLQVVHRKNASGSRASMKRKPAAVVHLIQKPDWLPTVLRSYSTDTVLQYKASPTHSSRWEGPFGLYRVQNPLHYLNLPPSHLSGNKLSGL